MDSLKEILPILREIWELELYNSGNDVVYLNQLVIALFVVVFGVLISRKLTNLLAGRLKSASSLDNNVVHVIRKVLHYLLVVIVVLVALPIAGIPITIFTVMGGAVAIGVGFGAQNLFNNLISGFILMVEQPIRIGDVVELGDDEGRVQDIGNRCVRVRRSDGVDVLLPNSYFLEQSVVNWTRYDNDVRGCVDVGVAYGSPVVEVKHLLLQCAAEHEKVYKEPPPIVLFEAFGDNSLNFSLLFWARVTRPMDMRIVCSDLRFAIDQAFADATITIAFPQRDVHLDTLAPLEVRLKRDA